MTYRVLIFGNEFVDESLLSSGIYCTILPILHLETTIEEIEEKWKRVYENIYPNDITMQNLVLQSIVNLKKCKLIDVELNKIQ